MSLDAERSEPAPRHLLEVWCTTCEHVHIPTVPVVTYRCNGAEGQGEAPFRVGCGYAGWYDTEAARHADQCPGHVVHPVFHTVVPLEQRPGAGSEP